MTSENFNFFAGVFDGHGIDGHKVAKACVAHLEDLVTGKKSPLSKTKEALIDYSGRPEIEDVFNNPNRFMRTAICNLHETIAFSSDLKPNLSGTTATVAIIDRKKINLGWVGDSKAVLFVTSDEDFKDLIPYNITSMHNLKSDEEQQRIKDAGGIVRAVGGNLFKTVSSSNTGPLRVFKTGADLPGLMVSKSIGDTIAKTIGVSHEADTISLNFEEIIFFSDLEDIIPAEYNAPNVDADLHKKLLQQRLDNEGASLAGSMLMRTLGRIRPRLASQATLSKAEVTLQQKSSSQEQNVGLDKSFAPETEINKVSNYQTLRREKNSRIVHCILIIASDGLWDIFPKEEVAKLLGRLLRIGSNHEVISKEICLEAQNKWRNYFLNTEIGKIDDISCISAILF